MCVFVGGEGVFEGCMVLKQETEKVKRCPINHGRNCYGPVFVAEGV